MKTKFIIAIAALAAAAFAFLLVQEFSAIPVSVEEAEEEQISREIAEQSKAISISKQYLVKCAPCHNRDGSGPVGAIIRGMDKDELVTALKAYKYGGKGNSFMEEFMKKISDEEINLLAEEIANF
jgi:cytochrome c553